MGWQPCNSQHRGQPWGGLGQASSASGLWLEVRKPWWRNSLGESLFCLSLSGVTLASQAGAQLCWDREVFILREMPVAVWVLAMHRTPLTFGSTNKKPEVGEVSLPGKGHDHEAETQAIVSTGWDFLEVTSSLLFLSFALEPFSILPSL